jgi:hypothetical protein
MAWIAQKVNAKCLALAALGFLAMVWPLVAQEPVITAETPASPAQLHEWLNSDDPRLIAWAADFARRTHDASIVAEIPPLIERWGVQRISASDLSRAGQGRATTALLDTLIQENVEAPAQMIEAIAESYPEQAAILIARLPMEESRTTLEDWTYGATGAWGARTLARVASMMLAKAPEPRFVARVVSEAEEELVVRVASSDEVGAGTGSGTFGDSMGTGGPAGWPEVFTYALVENDTDAEAPVVVTLDADKISSHRVEDGRGWGTCFGVEPLDAVTRHRLIAHWLGVQDKDLAWQAQDGATIAWKDRATYERQLGALVEAHREQLRATVETLEQRGLVTEGLVQNIPRLVVTIQCELEPCPLGK